MSPVVSPIVTPPGAPERGMRWADAWALANARQWWQAAYGLDLGDSEWSRLLRLFGARRVAAFALRAERRRLKGPVRDYLDRLLGALDAVAEFAELVVTTLSAWVTAVTAPLEADTPAEAAHRARHRRRAPERTDCSPAVLARALVGTPGAPQSLALTTRAG